MKKISVPDSMVDSLAAFVAEKGVNVEVIAGGMGDVVVAAGEDRRQSDLDTIYAGGWIACATALDLAEKMEIPREKVGEMLDHLDVKIRDCSLGCFK